LHDCTVKTIIIPCMVNCSCDRAKIPCFETANFPVLLFSK